jgi:AcrR family transcriptional regulator
MAALRWGTGIPVEPSEARERLTDAAEACFERFGVMKTTLADVSKHAKVSRATVYRYFQGRDDLILAVLLREAGRFLDRLGDRIATAPDTEAAIVDGVLYTLQEIRGDDRLALLFAPEVVGITSAVAGGSEALFEQTSAFLRPLLAAGQAAGQVRADLDVDDAAEWVLRAILSLITVEGPRQRADAELGEFIRTFLAAALVQSAGSAVAQVASHGRRRRNGATG